MSSYRMYLHGQSSINGEKSFTVLHQGNQLSLAVSKLLSSCLALAWPCARLGNLCPHTQWTCEDRAVCDTINRGTHMATDADTT